MGPNTLLQLSQHSVAAARETPVKRVATLLQEIEKTVKSEQEEDETLYKKLVCWCKANRNEKFEAVEKAQAEIESLNASIKSLSARSSELTTDIKGLEDEVSANKASLAEATALREKQLQEFHGSEMDSVQAIENLKAALEVLSKHHTGAFPQLWLSLLALGSKDEPWTREHEASRSMRSLSELIRHNGLDEGDRLAARTISQHFLQPDSAHVAGWSADDEAIVRRAVRAATGLLQARHGDGYYPSYAARSGEIVGILKQLKEEMESDLSEAQKLESSRAASFAELRAAKSDEIAGGEKMAEKKEDELATVNNDLAHAKEDLAQEVAALDEHQVFLASLKKTCATADADFAARSKARADEIKAVSETIAILMEDEARNTFNRTYSLIQVSSGVSRRGRESRQKAAAALRQSAVRAHDPRLSMLATAVELDSFARVKKAIDDMIAMLKVQQADEVKKNDFCKAELHETEMTTAKTDDRKAELEATEASLVSDIKALEEKLAEAGAEISSLHVNLQRASEDRQAENIDFQKTVADQTMVLGVLKKALKRLQEYYDAESLLQDGDTRAHARVDEKPAPPMAQKEYRPSKGALGVMQMMEKLMQEAKAMIAESKQTEVDAQVAYEQTVADTTSSVAALQKEIATKTKAKARATKERLQTGADIADTVRELEGLAKYNSELHAECDYLMKNFALRQDARAQEVVALQQAAQILSGASLS